MDARLIAPSYNPKDFWLNTQLEFKGNKAGPGESLYVEKTWGFEEIHINTLAYCCKTLHIEDNKATSKHFHLDKHETMIVINGILIIDIFNKDFTIKSFVVDKNRTFIIPPGLVHSLRCPMGIPYVELIECSTYSRDEDSIRII